MIARSYYPILAPLALLALSAAAAPAAEDPRRAEAKAAQARFGKLVNEAVEAEEPFFTPQQRAIIERACGYAPGSWNGRQINRNENVLLCADKRRVDTPEVAAVLEAAMPRVEAIMDRVMARPDIVQAERQMQKAMDAWVDARVAAWEKRPGR